MKILKIYDDSHKTFKQFIRENRLVDDWMENPEDYVYELTEEIVTLGWRQLEKYFEKNIDDSEYDGDTIIWVSDMVRQDLIRIEHI